MTQGDFGEAPSQMLEESFRNYGVLSSFARHYQTGEVLPRELFKRMTRALAYGRASTELRQLMFTGVSLDFTACRPTSSTSTRCTAATSSVFNTSEFVDGDHFWARYTHLNGYTYVLDKVIALDFFAQFDPNNLLGGPAGMRYRQTVLGPGATKGAAQLVRDFLGREPNLEAYRRWMLAEFDTAATSSSPAR